MKGICQLAAIGGIAWVSLGYAQAQDDPCRAIEDPTQRLACYDQRSGRAVQGGSGQASRPIPAAPAQTAPAPYSPQSAPAPEMTESRRDALKRRTDFDSSIKAVVTLRHGYYRLELADGTSYDTTTLVPPPQVGEAVHVRRTPFGTTFFDMEGRDPFTVRLSRRQ